MIKNQPVLTGKMSITLERHQSSLLGCQQLTEHNSAESGNCEDFKRMEGCHIVEMNQIHHQ